MKKVFIVAGIVLIVGIILVIFSVIISGGFVFNNKGAFKEEILDNAQFQNINIDVSSRKVYVYKAEDEKIKISYYQYDNDEITYKVENDTFTFTSKYIFSFKSIFSYGIGQDNSIKIYIPEKKYENVNLNIGSGEVTSELLFDTKNANIKCKSGEINLGEIKSENLDFIIYSGKGKISKIDCSNSSINVKSGKLTVNSISTDTLNFVLGSGYSKLDFSDKLSLFKIDAKIGSGEIKVYENNTKMFFSDDNGVWGSGDKKINIAISSGDVKFNFNNN